MTVFAMILLYWLVTGLVTMWWLRRVSRRHFNFQPGGAQSLEIAGKINFRKLVIVLFGPPLLIIVLSLIVF